MFIGAGLIKLNSLTIRSAWYVFLLPSGLRKSSSHILLASQKSLGDALSLARTKNGLVSSFTSRETYEHSHSNDSTNGHIWKIRIVFGIVPNSYWDNHCKRKSSGRSVWHGDGWTEDATEVLDRLRCASKSSDAKLCNKLTDNQLLAAVVHAPCNCYIKCSPPCSESC